MKRAAIYVYYDKNGLIADYALFFIKSLLEVCSKVQVVINGKIIPKELEKLKIDGVDVVQRKNIGYDFWAYREGVLQFKDCFYDIDELILCNSSVYGPFYPFFDMFDKMEKSEADFWGITLHPASDYKIIKNNKNTQIKEHIQSYFLVFKKKMLQDNRFLDYFLNMKKINGRKEAIGYLEIQLTEYFKNLGFKYDTYIKRNNEPHDNVAQYMSDYLIAKKCPVIKKTCFFHRYDLFQKKCAETSTKRAYELIKKTGYDTKLIIKDVLRNRKTGDIKKFLHLNFVIEGKKDIILHDKIALCVENDCFLPVADKFSNIFDIFHIENSSDKNYFDKIKEISKKYDYILYLSDNTAFLPPDIKSGYIEHIINCLMKDENYIKGIVSLFEKDDNIGVLTPIPFLFPDFEFYFNFVKKEEFLEFKNENNMNFIPDEKDLNLCSGSFWVKSEVLFNVDNINLNEKLNKGMIYSMLAQNSGFLTGSVAPSFKMAEYADNLQYKAQKIPQFLFRLIEKIERKLHKIVLK